VDRALTNGTGLWNAFKRIAAGFTADEKHALFFGTANRIYRLGQSAG
jgi:predicted TIM-barrel fold metal-dependent hydrolase